MRYALAWAEDPNAGSVPHSWLAAGADPLVAASPSDAAKVTEDVREEIYRIDRMLTQLALGGKFERMAGFAFGRCTDCRATSFSLEDILRDRFGAGPQPAVSGLSFGHIEQKLTIAMAISDRALVMGHGSIVFHGTPQTLRNDAYVRKEWLEV